MSPSTTPRVNREDSAREDLTSISDFNSSHPLALRLFTWGLSITLLGIITFLVYLFDVEMRAQKVSTDQFTRVGTRISELQQEDTKHTNAIERMKDQTDTMLADVKLIASKVSKQSISIGKTETEIDRMQKMLSRFITTITAAGIVNKDAINSIKLDIREQGTTMKYIRSEVSSIRGELKERGDK